MAGFRHMLCGPGFHRAVAVFALLTAAQAGMAADPQPIFDGQSLTG